MDFRALRSKLIDLPLFNFNDIRKIDPGFHRQQLTGWQKRNYIQPLAGGYYIFSDREVDEAFLFMAANRIYAPSYISLESALAIYQVIPETVLGVTSVSTRKTRRLESNWGMLTYRRIKPATYFGYEVRGGKENQKFLLARLEKAVLDYLYLNTHLRSSEDFVGLRWNQETLKSQMDLQLFEKFLAVYKNRALTERVQKMKDYLNA
jgi:predicted transcriptional regulator of viral defense system